MTLPVLMCQMFVLGMLIDLKHQVQLICHREYFSACENNYIIYLVLEAF